MNFIICGLQNCWNFGTGQKRVAEKASAMKNWSLIFFSGRAEASLFHIWMRCKKIWQ
ncbi:hypothetical protein ROSEINA2194_03703 [Roseburia inulinivorans DSM 16841]|uniref:Uncharacterized protein n=1 Tax=Roseburia inulinivorans DSM 16841 TaxID=622312 RepID=C0FY64_9FIRM|nr:hypothetical protein ROSEINA2194_03703 [Roseburia inulinivorans DSM 16841]